MPHFMRCCSARWATRCTCPGSLPNLPGAGGLLAAVPGYSASGGHEHRCAGFRRPPQSPIIDATIVSPVTRAEMGRDVRSALPRQEAGHVQVAMACSHGVRVGVSTLAPGCVVRRPARLDVDSGASRASGAPRHNGRPFADSRPAGNASAGLSANLCNGPLHWQRAGAWRLGAASAGVGGCTWSPGSPPMV